MSFFIAHCAKKIKLFDLFTREIGNTLRHRNKRDRFSRQTSKRLTCSCAIGTMTKKIALTNQNSSSKACVQNLYASNFSQDHMTRPPIHTYIYGCVLVYVHVTSNILFIIWLMYKFGILYTN